MSYKTTKKTMSLDQLYSDSSVNVREDSNYDLPAMMEAIRLYNRITNPIIVDGDTKNEEDQFLVLQGNRRTRAGKLLFTDPTSPQELVDALKKVDVVVYTGLTDQERQQLIMDHGGTKPLAKSEIVRACWRLDLAGYSEIDIINLMYFSLADYTGNKRKLAEVPAKKSERDAFLRKWLHGTVGNFILKGNRMGEYVRDQFHLTALAEDKLLPANASVEMKCSRDRITALSAAAEQDKASESGWDPDNGGPEFNALIEKFKAEDAGVQEKETNGKRLTPKELEERANAFSSPLTRAALLMASGNKEMAEKLSSLDLATARQTKVLDHLAAQYNRLPDGPTKDLARLVLNNSPKEFLGNLELLIGQLTPR